MTAPAADAPAALAASDLTKRYDAEGEQVEAVRNVDLRIAAGSFVAIMGPSGCGKSTLLHLLGGLVRPTSGHVLVDGRDLAGMADHQLAEVRRHRVGFVFQAFNLVPVLTVEENVALPATIAGRDRSWTRGRVDELIAAVGLEHRRAAAPSKLSGGEQQRVAIARALMMEPAVVLADEPTGNLDSASGAQVVRLLRDLNAGGQTIVLVTHDVKVAGVADRLLTMADGRIHEPERSRETVSDAELLDRLLDAD